MDLVRKFKNFKLDNLECRYGCDGVCPHREQNTCKCYAAEIERRGDECLAENRPFDPEIVKYLSEQKIPDYLAEQGM